MDKDQVQVIQILLDTFMKLILAGVAVGLLIGFAIAWTRNPSWPIGIVEVFLGMTVRVVYRHYFPSSPKEKSTTLLRPGD